MLRRQLLSDRVRHFAIATLFGTPAGILLAFAIRAYQKQHEVSGIYVLLFIFTLIATVQAIQGIWLLMRPDRHWLAKCLSQISPRPWELARAIDDDWRAEVALVEGTVPSVLPWWRLEVFFTVLTPSWLIHVSRGKIVILMPDRISWVYCTITANPATIAFTRFFHGIICRMDNGTTELPISTRTEMIGLWLASELVRRKPAVLAGYQGDSVELSRTDPAGLNRRAEQRRVEFEALPPAEQALWIEEAISDLEEFPRRVDPYAPETRIG